MLIKISTVFFAALLLDLFNIVLNKIAKFTAKTSFQQIRSAVGYLYNILVNINPKKSLKQLLPLFITSIYREINIHNTSIMADMEIPLGDHILI